MTEEDGSFSKNQRRALSLSPRRSLREEESFSQEEENFSQETRAESMDETSFSLESISSRRMQDDESGSDCERSEKDLSTDPENVKVMPDKLDHALVDTSDLSAWQWNLEKSKRKFGPYFVDEKQLELFCLLPLSNTQRVQLLQTIRSPA